MRSLVDELAQEIRRVDGNHDKGAGELAEALMPFIRRMGEEKVSRDPWYAQMAFRAEPREDGTYVPSVKITGIGLTQKPGAVSDQFRVEILEDYGLIKKGESVYLCTGELVRIPARKIDES